MVNYSSVTTFKIVMPITHIWYAHQCNASTLQHDAKSSLHEKKQQQLKQMWCEKLATTVTC